MSNGIPINGRDVLAAIDEWARRRTDEVVHGGGTASPSESLDAPDREPDQRLPTASTAANDDPGDRRCITSSEGTQPVVRTGAESRTTHSNQTPRRLTREEREQDRLRKLGFAIMLVAKEPGLPDAEIARRVGVNRATLCKKPWAEYQLAAERARRLAAKKVAGGHAEYDDDGLRSVEAYSEVDRF